MSPRVEVPGIWDEFGLVLEIGYYLRQLLLNICRILRLTTDATQCTSGSVYSTLLDVPPWRFGQQNQTRAENNRPEELNGDGDTIRSGIITILGRIDDAIGEENTDGDAELVTRYDGASNFTRRDLGEVEDDDGGDETDTKPSDQSTGNKLNHIRQCYGLDRFDTRRAKCQTDQTQAMGRSFEYATNGEDYATGDDGDPATEEIGHISCYECAKEGSGG